MHILLGYKGYDHIDRNALNNRKSNLRKATRQENARNRSLSTNNTSGCTGVHFNKSHNRWVAGIGYNNKHIRLGEFIDKADAIVARLKAEKEYYGEFAPQRHLFEEYNIV